MTQPKQKTIYIKEKTNDWGELMLTIAITASVAIGGTMAISGSYREYASVRDGTGEYYHDKFLKKQYREKSHEDLCKNCKIRAEDEKFGKEGWQCNHPQCWMCPMATGL